MFAVDHIILLSAVLAILGVLASKLSPRFGVPVLVLFLGVGMLAGEDGIGRIFFDNADAAHAIGTFALILILFDGGLQTSKKSIAGVETRRVARHFWRNWYGSGHRYRRYGYSRFTAL